MEARMHEYEEFIKKELENPKKSKYSKEQLLIIHQDAIKNFQHERAIHLAITLFFVGFTILFIFLSALIAMLDPTFPIWPFMLVDALMVIWSAFYVKHYYYLENHTQKLYDLTCKIV